MLLGIWGDIFFFFVSWLIAAPSLPLRFGFSGMVLPALPVPAAGACFLAVFGLLCSYSSPCRACGLAVLVLSTDYHGANDAGQCAIHCQVSVLFL
jgi:hypothetical protein